MLLLFVWFSSAAVADGADVGDRERLFPARTLIAAVLLGTVGLTAAMAEFQIADAKLEEAILHNPQLRGPGNRQALRDLRSLRDALSRFGRNVCEIVMSRLLLHIAAAILVLSPMAVLAEPIKLKLAYFTSDRSLNYLAAIKPFVDAVNDEGQGLVEIRVYFSGVLGAGQARQPGLVEKGVADIAFIVPGQNPEQFYDESVIELPGLFRSSGEATRVFTKLITARALKGYENLYVIGAFASAEPCCINTRNVVASLQALKGLKISVNNRMEATALEKLGAIPVLIAAPQALAAISGGNIDGTSAPPSLLYEFGLGRVAIHHYVLATSAAPLALVMNRQKFDALPEAAKALIRKFSGEWIATRWIEGRRARDAEVSDQIKSDTRRTVTIASPADLETTRQVYQTIIDDWAGNSARNRELLYLVLAELAKVRAAEPGNSGAAAPKD